MDWATILPTHYDLYIYRGKVYESILIYKDCKSYSIFGMKDGNPAPKVSLYFHEAPNFLGKGNFHHTSLCIDFTIVGTFIFQSTGLV